MVQRQLSFLWRRRWAFNDVLFFNAFPQIWQGTQLFDWFSCIFIRWWSRLWWFEKEFPHIWQTYCLIILLLTISRKMGFPLSAQWNVIKWLTNLSDWGLNFFSQNGHFSLIVCGSDSGMIMSCSFLQWDTRHLWEENLLKQLGQLYFFSFLCILFLLIDSDLSFSITSV